MNLSQQFDLFSSVSAFHLNAQRGWDEECAIHLPPDVPQSREFIRRRGRADHTEIIQCNGQNGQTEGDET